METSKFEGYRISPQQRRLWSLQPESAAYRSQCSVFIQGDLNQEFLRTAVQEVIRRHEILRTTFQRPQGMKLPLQVIGDPWAVTWQAIEETSLDSAEEQVRIEELLQAERRRSFDFARGPLLRLVLITLSPPLRRCAPVPVQRAPRRGENSSSQRHVLLVTLPSICSDGWGLQNLVREIAQGYSAAGGGEALVDEPMQYADLSEWQNEGLESEDEEGRAGRAFWRDQRVLSQPELSLPFEIAQSPDSCFEPERVTRSFDRETWAGLEQLAEEANSTVSAVLLACWQSLLGRLTGQTEILIGYCSDGRKYEELDAPMGLFARWLPLVTTFDGDQSLLQVLRQTSEGVRQAVKWQESFDWGQMEAPEGKQAALRFFPFCYEFYREPVTVTAGGLTFSIVRQYTGIERYKVQLSVGRQGEALVAGLHYDPLCYGRQEIDRLAGQFETLVADAVARPQVSISQLAILPEAQRAQVLVDLNQTEALYPHDRCFHELFEEQAERQPDRPALVFENQRLTYSQLNARANQVAHNLRSLGAGPDARVALCMERSLESVVGILGILKAGAAYVPLDPALPGERLAFMLADTGARLLLTQRRLPAELPEHRAEVIYLDGDTPTLDRQSEVNPSRVATSGNLAYVIYTSGSTGMPKGAAVEHRSLVNYVHSIIQRLDMPEGASFATVSTFAADLGHTTVFGALATGGCLHVISEQRAGDPECMAEYARLHRIDVLKIVPSHLAALLTGSRPEAVLPRQRLVLGGEAARWELVDRVRELAPECAVFNHYGPTETTVGVLTCRLEECAMRPGGVSLGRPLANTRIYVLDRHLNPVPLGVAGELYIGGAGLARHYLGRPELTAERFIPDPFAGRPGARLYRTGDLARYQRDGNLEFLGRVDHQVKLRGFRIELGEIEAALRRCPAVRDCVVIAREEVAGEPRLVGYVLLPHGEAIDIGKLRGFLQESLPEFMIPSVFVPLDALPLTANGKLDRKALPAPDQVRSRREDQYVAPRTPVEEIMAGIWAEVLGQSAGQAPGRVGIHDNFFELGGHSLLATQVVARVRNAFQVEVPLRSLFGAPTVAGLTAALLEDPSRRAKVERTAQLLVSLSQMSDDEVESMLEESTRRLSTMSAGGNDASGNGNGAASAETGSPLAPPGTRVAGDAGGRSHEGAD